MKNLLSEKVDMFPDILPVKVTEVIKRCMFNHNIKKELLLQKIITILL